MNDEQFEVESIDAPEFIRKYSLMMFDIDALKMGLLLSIGFTMTEASILVMNGDKDRILGAVSTLMRIGFINHASAFSGESAGTG